MMAITTTSCSHDTRKNKTSGVRREGSQALVQRERCPSPGFQVMEGSPSHTQRRSAVKAVAINTGKGRSRRRQGRTVALRSRFESACVRGLCYHKARIFLFNLSVTHLISHNK